MIISTYVDYIMNIFSNVNFLNLPFYDLHTVKALQREGIFFLTKANKMGMLYPLEIPKTMFNL